MFAPEFEYRIELFSKSFFSKHSQLTPIQTLMQNDINNRDVMNLD
jgi:hypothetical protein